MGLMEVAPIATWRSAVQRGVGWLTAQLDANPPFAGADVDVNWYCKLPWALAGAGNRAAALRALGRVQGEYLETGLVHCPGQTGWTNAVSYALGWLVVGARVAEALGPARKGYEALGKYVCPDTGGLYSVPLERTDESPYFDAAIQGAVIHAALMMGDLEAARRAGRTALWFIDHQPDRGAGIYNYFHPKRGYLTEVNDRNRFQCMFVAGTLPQPYANLGFMLQGLCRLFDATGDVAFRDGCGRLVDVLLDDFGPDLLSHSQNHKVAHAMLMLWARTGTARYRDGALRIAPLIAENILPDGRALADVLGDDIENQTPFFTVRTTCDSVLWLSQICDMLDGCVDNRP